MTKLSDQIAALEMENEALKIETDKQREIIAKREGEILGNRRHMAGQDKVIQRQAAHITTLEGHFRLLHGSANSVAAQRENVRQAEAEAPKTSVAEAREIAKRLAPDVPEGTKPNGNGSLTSRLIGRLTP